MTLAVGRITALALNVADLARAVDFYVEGLGFRVETQAAEFARLALGEQRIELAQRPGARSYPRPRAANDPWFQHFAIAVADMGAAHARLSRLSPEPITIGGPQLLPPSTGSVTAYKFRDPDGHPLELSHAPGGDWSRVAAAPGAAPFLGIDHTALAVGSLAASIAFYTALGFRPGPRFLNQGPEQARLDGLTGATVDIVTLFTPERGPHIELLHYRSPAPAGPLDIAPGDLAASEIVLAPLGGAADAANGRHADPDGHLLRFTASPP